MADEQKEREPGVLSYPNRPGLHKVTVEEMATREEAGPTLEYPARQPGYEKPTVKRTDGVIIGHGTKLDVLARRGFLEAANLEGLTIDGHLVAENRQLSGAVLRQASIRHARVAGWSLQGADCSMMKIEDSDCRNWTLDQNTKVSGMRLTRCNIDGLRAPGLKPSALQDCVGIPAEIGSDE